MLEFLREKVKIFFIIMFLFLLKHFCVNLADKLLLFTEKCEEKGRRASNFADSDKRDCVFN